MSGAGTAAGSSGNGAWHDDISPAWDVIDRRIIDHVTGDNVDGSLELVEVIQAFHTAAVAVAAPIYPGLLVQRFAIYPAGAYASRITHGAKLFTDDVAGIWQDCIDAAKQKYVGWPEPVDFELVRYGGQQVGPEHLPPALWPFVHDVAELMGVATSSVALGAIVSCSAVIHEDWELQPKRHDTDWTEQARLWGAIVGPPSVLKTPVIRACTAPLDGLEIAAREKWGEAVAVYKVAIKAWKAAEKEAPGTAGPAPVKPHVGRYLVEDATIAALSEVLRAERDEDGKMFAPQGKVLVRADELAELIATMDDTSGGKGPADRGAYLRLYNGGRFTVDRIVRGAFPIPSWSGCLLGGIQPEPIQRIAIKAVNDGMLQRFLFNVPHPSTRGIDRTPDYEARKAYRALFPALAALKPGTWPQDHNRIEIVQFHVNAQAAHDDMEELKKEVLVRDNSPRMMAQAGKLVGQFARLALTFHLVEIAAARAKGDIGPPVSAISVDTAERARRYMRDIAVPHMLRADSLMFNTPDTDHAAWIAGYILARKLDRVTTREIVQDHKALRAPERRQTLYSVMDTLCVLGWLEAEEPTNAYKPPTAWAVNPRVHLAFAERAQLERERRAAVRAAIEAEIAAARAKQTSATA